jgi:hypothetical protein
MRRDLNKFRYLLKLVEANTDFRGIHRDELSKRWEETETEPALTWGEFVYLLDRGVEAGFVNVRTGYVVLSWEGHNWLDRNRDTSFPL